MELRTLARKNTIVSLNKQAFDKVPKIESNKQLNEKENVSLVKSPYQSHHAFQFIRGTFPTQSDFKKFVSLLYKGLYYGIKSLKGPSDSYVKKKKVRLPEPKDSKHKKILFMDLDETLIHSQFPGNHKYQETQVKIEHEEMQFHFNIRPYCLQFLQKMSKIYNVYVFTAGTEQYASVIINYLNKQKKCISGFLHRRNCMETNNGYNIKDLRIVQNRQLKDIIIVDNLVHSFGLQIQNGIPILEFIDQKNDKELLGIQELLTDLAEVDDVRDYLREKLALKKVLGFNQNLYLKVQNYFAA